MEEKNKLRAYKPGDLVMNRTLNVAGDDWETHMCVIVDAHEGMNGLPRSVFCRLRLRFASGVLPLHIFVHTFPNHAFRID